MNNLVQYSPMLVAFGCNLKYHSEDATVEIIEKPKRKDRILEDALEDISKFEDTANYQDGIASLVLATFVDEDENPLKHSVRLNILNALGIMSDERFIVQALNAAKVNRSWHISEKSGECTYFGDYCTHRGITTVPGKRGRKSNREPWEYHPKSSKGIGREQLVTVALQKAYDSIPESSLVTIKAVKQIQFDIEALRQMPSEDISKLIDRLRSAIPEEV